MTNSKINYSYSNDYTVCRLEYMPYGNCKAIKYYNDEGGIQNVILRSYSTDVINIDYELGIIEISGTYSATTTKHIIAFLKEYFPKLTYKDVKHLYINGEYYNFFTGESIKSNYIRGYNGFRFR